MLVPRSMFIGMLAAAMALLVGCNGSESVEDDGAVKTPAADDTMVPLVIRAQHTGQQSGVEERMIKLITSQSELDALGSEELSKLKVDFQSRSLVVATMGQRSTGGFWVWIDGVQKRGGRLYVQGRENRPAMDEMTTQVITTPYAAVEIDRVSGGLLLVESFEPVTGKPSPAEMGGI